MGLNGSPYGHRVDVLVLDDLIDLSNAANVDAQVEWIERIADTRLTKNGIVIVVGSRIREKDLYDAMLESGWIHKSLILPASFVSRASWGTIQESHCGLTNGPLNGSSRSASA